MKKLLKNINLTYLILLIYGLLAIVVLRKLLFQEGTIGHNWDWGIPYFSTSLKRATEISLFIWDDLNIGAPVVMNVPVHKLFGFVGLFGFLGFNGDFVSKFVVLSTILISAISMFFLARHILNLNMVQVVQKSDVTFAAFIAGIFYGFSPLLFNMFIAGSLGQFFSYAFIPLFILVSRKYMEKGKGKFVNLFQASLFLSVVGISIQNLIISLIIIFSWIIFTLEWYRFKKLINIILLYILFNLDWFFSVIYHISDVQRVQLSQSFVFNLNAPTIMQLFMNAGYGDRHFFLRSIHTDILNIWYLVAISIIIIIFLSSIILKKEKNQFQEFIFWSSLFLIGMLFSSYGNSPAKNFIYYGFEHIPLMNIFRSTQNSLPLMYISFALLLALSCAIYLITFKNHKIVSVLSIILILFYLNPFFLHGDIGLRYLQERYTSGNYIDQYKYPDEFEKLNSYILNDDTISRTLFLPPSGSPLFIANEFQRSAQGGDPLISGSPFNIISDFGSANTPYTSDLINSVLWTGLCDNFSLDTDTKNEQSRDNLIAMLSKLNVKYIYLRKDVVPAFGYCDKRWQYTSVRQNLEKSNALKLLKSEEYTSLYMSNYFLPRIYTPKTIIYSRENITDFPQISAAQNMRTGFFFKNINADSERFIKSKFYFEDSLNKTNSVSRIGSTPVIEFKKINPSKYRVNVYNATEPFMLIFSESFHNGWKAYISNKSEEASMWESVESFNIYGTLQNDNLENGYFFETWLKAPIDKKNHLLVNGYANGWYIQPERKNFELILEYWPQRIYTSGLLISGLTVIFCATYLFYIRIKKEE